MVIQVKSIISAADTDEQGEQLFAAIAEVARRGEPIVLSFVGIKTASTSFANTAFVPLLDTMTFEDIKRRLVVIESTRQINEMIKWRLGFEADKNRRLTA